MYAGCVSDYDISILYLFTTTAIGIFDEVRSVPTKENRASIFNTIFVTTMIVEIISYRIFNILCIIHVISVIVNESRLIPQAP